MPHATTVFWFRRDLRLHDNAGLYHALHRTSGNAGVYFWYRYSGTTGRQARQTHGLYSSTVGETEQRTAKFGSRLHVYHGKPIEVWRKICAEIPVAEVFTNHDYEPYARKRDTEIEAYLKGLSIGFHTYKDQVIFEKNEVAKEDGTAYAVFTPYMKRWRAIVTDQDLQSLQQKIISGISCKRILIPVLSLEQIGFDNFPVEFPSPQLREEVIRQYAENRDFPGIDGTSRLSVHMRFGTVSMQELFRFAWNISEKWTNELIWREFYMQILWHFPHVVKGAFKPQYDFWNGKMMRKNLINGVKEKQDIQSWMQECVNWTRNRIHAQPCAHDYRDVSHKIFTDRLALGERLFCSKLLDFELSSNNGGWQWSAGTESMQLYFRVFSMDEQTRRFDPDFKYIKNGFLNFRIQLPSSGCRLCVCPQTLSRFLSVGFEIPEWSDCIFPWFHYIINRRKIGHLADFPNSSYIRNWLDVCSLLNWFDFIFLRWNQVCIWFLLMIIASVFDWLSLWNISIFWLMKNFKTATWKKISIPTGSSEWGWTTSCFVFLWNTRYCTGN